MQNDPLFNVQLPEWWNRTAFLVRGLSLGFLLGYLFAIVVTPKFSLGTFLVVSVTLIIAILPSLPKAWIEQRNRIRAATSSRSEKERQ